MGKTYRVMSALVVGVIAAVGVYYVYQSQRAHRAGMVSETIEHKGDVWETNFSARLPAPEASVFDAIKNFENSHSEEIKSVKVLSETEDEKTVEMTLAAPAGQTITTVLQFHYFPEDRKITYKTVNATDFATDAEYQLTDEGANTLLKFHGQTKITQQLPVPDGVIKHVIRGTFMAQLEGLRRSLHIQSAQADEDADEP
ncbi:MAG TPA: SRPBCC family protein [Candidatus Binataceae bacterium]|nr:SRPBCC family protein [Candidatus Binataceae bacterium]